MMIVQENPVERLRNVRRAIAEQNAKMPKTDHNGYPTRDDGVRNAADLLAQAHNAGGDWPGKEAPVQPRPTTPIEALRSGALPVPPGPSIEDRLDELVRDGRWREVIGLIGSTGSSTPFQDALRYVNAGWTPEPRG